MWRGVALACCFKGLMSRLAVALTGVGAGVGGGSKNKSCMFVFPLP
jgi:hypothetical protein